MSNQPGLGSSVLASSLPALMLGSWMVSTVLAAAGFCVSKFRVAE